MGARGHWELLEHSPDSISFKCQMLTIFSGLNSKRLYGSSGKEKESHCLVFTSSRKREIFKVFSRRSRAATPKKCIKNVMHVQSCCFANLNLLLFFHSRRRLRRRCLRSLLLERGTNRNSG